MSLPEGAPQSPTLYPQNIVLEARDAKIPLRLKRHLAPRTVRQVLASLPLHGHAHTSDDMVYITTQIKSGVERGRDALAAGDVAFLPGQRCLCFITKSHSTRKLMTPLGSMIGDVAALDSLRPGDVISVYEEAG